MGGPSPSPPPAGLGVGLSAATTTGLGVGLSVGAATGLADGLSVGAATGSAVGLSVGAPTGSAVGLSVGTATGDPTTGEPLPGLLAGESTGGLTSVLSLGDSPLPPVGAPDPSAFGCNAGCEPVADGAIALPSSPESPLVPDPGLEAPESPVVGPWAAAMLQLHSSTAAHRAAAVAAACRPHALLLRLCILQQWAPGSDKAVGTPAPGKVGSDEWK